LAQTFFQRFGEWVDWVERGYFVVWLLGALGAGKIVNALLVTHTSLPHIWVTPIWLISSALVLAIIVRVAKAQKTGLTKQLPTESRESRSLEELTKEITTSGKLHAVISVGEFTLSRGEFKDVTDQRSAVHIELLEVDDETGATLAIRSRFGAFECGEEVVRKGLDRYWLPKNEGGYPRGRLTNYIVSGESSLVLVGVTLYHVNPHAKQATLVVTFVSVPPRI
jgi:hypothetical protein